MSTPHFTPPYFYTGLYEEERDRVFAFPQTFNAGISFGGLLGQRQTLVAQLHIAKQSCWQQVLNGFIQGALAAVPQPRSRPF